MKIKFWGVRGSIPTPLTSSDINIKLENAIWKARSLKLNRGPEAEFDSRQKGIIREFLDELPISEKGTIGGNTPCVQIIPSDDTTVILDGGSGIRPLALELMKGNFRQGKGTTHIFFSHTHWDHICGIPFFIPLFIPGNRHQFYSGHGDLEKRLKQQHQPWYFPVPWESLPAEKTFTRLSKEQPIEIGALKVQCYPMFHPGGSYGYRLNDADGSSVIYATDVEFKRSNDNEISGYLDFIKGADALIFDSMYTLTETIAKEDWGHSSAMIGVDLALQAGVRNLIMFHHKPTNDDFTLVEIYEKTKEYQDLFDPGRKRLAIHLAYENLVIDLNSLK